MESANSVLSLLDINDFLENPENIDIVRKHYKLWLESTNILNEIVNQSIFVDCESLLYNIEENSKEFVATHCIIESYLEPSDPEYDHQESYYDYGCISELNILDCIFK